MQHIETVTVGSGGAASITFSAIPDAFTDLLLKFSFRGSGVGNTSTMTFNGSTSGYSFRRLRGTGSGADSYSEASQSAYNMYVHVVGSDKTSNTFSNGEIYIANYRSSVAKSFSVDVVTENNATEAFQVIVAGLWGGTDPITSITINAPSGSNFVEHSSASLYGITAGSDGIVAVS